jgi:hypothetical protein
MPHRDRCRRRGRIRHRSAISITRVPTATSRSSPHSVIAYRLSVRRPRCGGARRVAMPSTQPRRGSTYECATTRTTPTCGVRSSGHLRWLLDVVCGPRGRNRDSIAGDGRSDHLGQVDGGWLDPAVRDRRCHQLSRPRLSRGVRSFEMAALRSRRDDDLRTVRSPHTSLAQRSLTRPMPQSRGVTWRSASATVRRATSSDAWTTERGSSSCTLETRPRCTRRSTA